MGRSSRKRKSSTAVSRPQGAMDRCYPTRFEFPAQVFWRMVVGSLLAIASLPIGVGLLFLVTAGKTTHPYFGYGMGACVVTMAGLMGWLLWWSQMPEAIEIDEHGLTSRLHGRVEWADVSSYRFAMGAYPPKLTVTLKDRRKVRITLRPHEQGEVVDHYAACIGCIVDGIDSHYRQTAALRPGATHEADHLTLEEASNWQHWLIPVCVCLVVIGLVVVPQRMVIMLPVLLAVVGGVLANKSWRERRGSRSAETLSRH